MMKVAALLLAVVAVSSARSFERDIPIESFDKATPAEYTYGQDSIWNFLKYGRTFPYGSLHQDLPYFYGKGALDTQFYGPYAQYYYGKHFYPSTYEHATYGGKSFYPTTFEHGIYGKSFYPSTFEGKYESYPYKYEQGFAGKSAVYPFNYESGVHSAHPFYNFMSRFGADKTVYPSTFEHQYESYPIYNSLVKSGVYNREYPHYNMESAAPYTGEFYGPYSYYKDMPYSQFYGYPSFYNHYNYPAVSAGEHTPYYYNSQYPSFYNYLNKFNGLY